jgi:hypothetical protein
MALLSERIVDIGKPVHPTGTADLPAIMSTLTSAVYNYHISIITAGDFLTNDQTGAPLPGNSYANIVPAGSDQGFGRQ